MDDTWIAILGVLVGLLPLMFVGLIILKLIFFIVLFGLVAALFDQPPRIIALILSGVFSAIVLIPFKGLCWLVENGAPEVWFQYQSSANIFFWAVLSPTIAIGAYCLIRGFTDDGTSEAK